MLDPSQPITLVGFQMLLYTAMWGAAWLILVDERPAVGHWCLYSLLLMFGLGMISQRPSGPPWLTDVLGNICTLASFVALRRGAGTFLRLPCRDIEHLVLAGGVGLALLWIGPSADGLPARGVVMASSIAVLFLRMGGELFGPLRHQFGRRTAWLGVVPLVAFGVVNLARLLLGLAGSPLVAGVHQASSVNHVLIYVGVFAAAVFNFLFLFLLVMRLLGRLTFLAEHDPLTGLLNRRAMQTLLEREWQRHLRLGEPFALISMDIDHFKRINDHHGHPVGDAVLRALATTLKAQARTIDHIARMGGEEFLLLLPGVDTSRGVNAAQRLRHALSVQPQVESADGLTVTASLGVASPLPGDPQVDVVLRRADAALYLAKRNGRDQVVTQDEVAARGSDSMQPTTTL
ncbi:MAG: diguanylate cyclase [Leptothrix sp. (in: b-proteobacteria)]